MESLENFIKKFHQLSGVANTDTEYLIKITFEENLLFEHKNIKGFESTTNRYYYHSEETHPPVKAHYHIISKNSKKEIYSVNVDGTAHHKKNKGYQIPNKEANELRKLGVNINPDNIIENITINYENKNLIMENLENALFIKIE